MNQETFKIGPLYSLENDYCHLATLESTFIDQKALLIYMYHGIIRVELSPSRAHDKWGSIVISCTLGTSNQKLGREHTVRSLGLSIKH